MFLVGLFLRFLQVLVVYVSVCLGLRVYVCACVRACVRACVCVCVCEIASTFCFGAFTVSRMCCSRDRDKRTRPTCCLDIVARF